VNGFTLDPSTGEFVLTHPRMQIPEKKAIYSINEGNTKHWFEPVQRYVSDLKTGPVSYSARYVGSMVADVHRTLIYGGIFLYPADKVKYWLLLVCFLKIQKNKTKNKKQSSKQGKLRLLYEANPMALIIEAAGGLACDGNSRLLSIQPSDIHQRTGVVMGSKLEVEKFLAYTGGKAQ
jgi:fructose-1,6-bisphosphatase I